MLSGENPRNARGEARQKLLQQTMVRISLAAALLMPFPDAAQAQLDINCAQALQFDTLAVCGGGGTLKVTAKSGKVFSSGCAFALGAPQQAKCTVKSFATTGSLQVKVSATAENLTGAGTMAVKSFNIGTGAGGATKTYTDAMLTATPLVFGIGAQAMLNGGQAFGNYSGGLVLTVTFTP